MYYEEHEKIIVTVTVIGWWSAASIWDG